MDESRYPGTAIILAGGKSTRMGFDKQLLTLDGVLVLDRLLEQLDRLFQETLIVSNTPELHRQRSSRTVSDIVPDRGPLGGLHAGLVAARHLICFVTACDMPELNAGYIRHLLAAAEENPTALAVATRSSRGIEPLNALYAKSLIGEVETLLRAGDRGMAALLETVQTHWIEEAAAREYSPDWAMFRNVNTPEELGKIRKKD